MGKNSYFLEKKGYGKYSHYVPRLVSNKKAKELESQGIQLFNSRTEAHAEAKRRKRI